MPGRSFDALKEMDLRFGKQTSENKIPKHDRDFRAWRYLTVNGMELRFKFSISERKTRWEDVEVYGFKTNDHVDEYCFSGPAAYDAYVRFLDGVTAPHIATLKHWNHKKELSFKATIKQRESQATKGLLDELVATGSSAATDMGILFYEKNDNIPKACAALDQRFGERTIEDEGMYDTFVAKRRLTIKNRTVDIEFTYDKYYGPSHVRVRGLGQVAGLPPRHLGYEAFVYLIDALLLLAPDRLYEVTTYDPYLVKIQHFAKRFIARKKLAELKQIISGDMCGICIEPLILGRHTTPCGHLFHTSCIDRWKAIKPKCPMCRRQLA
jgi:hypothetical protein